MCGFFNLLECVCVNFVMSVCLCMWVFLICGCVLFGFCNVWVYVCVDFVKRGCVYVWIL